MTLDAQIQLSNKMEESQEPQMTQRTLSLMDVLAPPGNQWLAELSRRKADLPAGVQIAVSYTHLDVYKRQAS